MLYQVELSLDSNKTALALIADHLIPSVFNLEAFLFKIFDGGKTNTDKYNQSKKLISDIIGSSLGVEAQAKGTEEYINQTVEKWGNGCSELLKTYHPFLNDALQSNFRVLIGLTDDCSGLNVNVLKLEAYILKTFSDQNSGLENYIRSRELIRKIISLSLELTTHVTHTGRCLNSLLAPSASVHTKKRRATMKRKEIMEMYSEF